jgi:hypothetical protein
VARSLARHDASILDSDLGAPQSEEALLAPDLVGKEARDGDGAAPRALAAEPRRQHQREEEAMTRSARARRRRKDPRGGLTAEGRRDFARREGSRLKPGVKKPATRMTPEEMRRKGSWAVRFYGRKTLPPLLDARGRPTRFALSAHAWGEPVPRTAAAARRIAAKGRRLLERYARTKSGGSRASTR